MTRAAFRIGTYSSPVGEMEIMTGALSSAVSFRPQGSSVKIVFNFRSNGSFNNFEVQDATVELPPPSMISSEGSFMHCVHLGPKYKGDVFLRKGTGAVLDLFLCPDCKDDFDFEKDTVRVATEEAWDIRGCKAIQITELLG